jgi:hypothetical protein
MRDDVHVDWSLIETCNFRCKYCFCSESSLGSKVGKVSSATQWLAAFKGDTIDFIRRKIFTNKLTPQPRNQFVYDGAISWEIWGTGPVISPVPEPATPHFLASVSPLPGSA